MGQNSEGGRGVFMVIDIRDIKEGMVLRSAARDASGRVLLPATSALSARHIEKLQNWGIKSLDVVVAGAGPPPPGAKADPGQDEAEKKRIAVAQRLETLFKGTLGESLMIDLKRLSLEHWSRNLDQWGLMTPEEPT